MNEKQRVVKNRLRVLEHAKKIGNIRYRGSCLVLFQDANDLFFGISLALHFETSLGQNYREIPHTGWLELRGYGQRCMH